ncbi:hypothetical protein THRCLA_21433 [Thraustotheca clavata]|uniref:Homeobox domain-containing protein n=1 Tax=Thraustotheca clavata TaxID=74557 RepID=A0A1V9ZWI0_9STRA|nr:hypothetical protein THRCLA_21433 [Thraustotheca clavata]
MTLPNVIRAPASPATDGSISSSSESSREYEDSTAEMLLSPCASLLQDIESTMTHLSSDPKWTIVSELFGNDAMPMKAIQRNDVDAATWKQLEAYKAECLNELLRVLGKASDQVLKERYVATFEKILATVLRDLTTNSLSTPVDMNMGLQTKKRANLSKVAKRVLRTWFDAHFHHPYPTEEEKEMLSAQGGITMDQVNNWFINTRVREWKPKIHKILADNAAGNTQTLEAMLDRVKAPFDKFNTN